MDNHINYTTYTGFLDRNKDQGILLDVMGRYLTQALFIEMHTKNTNYPAIYTMTAKNKDVPSARLIYANSVDEYEAAMKLVGNMDHWEKLCALTWFMEGTDAFEGLNKWREDMRLRDESLAKRVLMEQAQAGNVPAAKALLEYNKKQGAGRPSNKTVSGADLKKADTLTRMRNLGLTTLNGNS